MTQDALANMADISPKYLGEIERGNTNLSITVLCKIADALEIEPSDLLICVKKPHMVSEKEHYLNKIRVLLKNKDLTTLKKVAQTMELLLEE